MAQQQHPHPHPHPPPHKQASITPLPLPLPSTQFSSSSPKTMLDPASEPKSYLSLLDHLERRLSEGHESYDHAAMNYGSRLPKTVQNYENYRFGAVNSMVEEDESGFSTPPLWRTSPPRSPQHRQNINYRCLSPSSKAQAIARGQKELMDMVSKMPESCYELSLKDLVEHHHHAVGEPKQENFAAEGKGVVNDGKKKKAKNNKQNNPKPQINRSGSIDNGGFLLKMVFPISLGSKKNKKKKNDSSTSHNSKVSPKPTVSDASGKSVDKDWWKKRSGSSESESGGSTLNSGSTKSSRSSSSSNSSSSNSRHEMNGCLAFIFNRKSRVSR